MENRTKISISKKLNTDLNILCAKLGLRKTVFLETLTKVPLRDLRELLAKEIVSEEVVPEEV